MEINNENQNKKRLGRGLGSLLAGADVQGLADYSGSNTQTVKENQNKSSALQAESATSENKIWSIAIDKLVAGVYQPRKNFDKASLQELAESIKQNGIIQPITVRKRSAGGYEIIAGERRWRAAQIAGLHEVPAVIKQVADSEALQIALIENIQREDLDPIEEAESYQRLMDEFSLSQLHVAEKVGKERSTVANALRLLSLPKELKEMLSQKTISAGHAKVLLSVADKQKQIQFAKECVEKNLSVRSLESLVKENSQKPTPAAGATFGALDVTTVDIASKLAHELADQLQKSLGTKVKIDYSAGRGSVNIQFYSDEQLTEIYEKLKAE